MRRRNILFLEVSYDRLQIGLLDDHRIAALAGVERDRITSTALAHTLRIHGSSTVLADKPLRCLVITDRAADLAGIEHGGDLAVGFLIKKESDLGAIDIR